MTEPTPNPGAPRYRKVLHLDSVATPLFFITCDEGWREWIVCQRMYEHVADLVLRALAVTAAVDAEPLYQAMELPALDEYGDGYDDGVRIGHNAFLSALRAVSQ